MCSLSAQRRRNRGWRQGKRTGTASASVCKGQARRITPRHRQTGLRSSWLLGTGGSWHSRITIQGYGVHGKQAHEHHTTAQVRDNPPTSPGLVFTTRRVGKNSPGLVGGVPAIRGWGRCVILQAGECLVCG